MGYLRKSLHIIEVTPTIDTAAYASGDHLGSLMTLEGSVREEEASSGSELTTLTIVDKASQDTALTVYLFDAAPTLVSVDNAALDISDAELADKCIGKIEVASADYTALANNSVATVSVSNLTIKAIDGATSCFAIMQAGEAGTYGSTTDLVLRFGLDQA